MAQVFASRVKITRNYQFDQVPYLQVDSRISLGRIMSCRNLIYDWLRRINWRSFDNIISIRSRKLANYVGDMYVDVMRDIVVCSCPCLQCEFRLVVSKHDL